MIKFEPINNFRWKGLKPHNLQQRFRRIRIVQHQDGNVTEVLEGYEWRPITIVPDDAPDREDI